MSYGFIIDNRRCIGCHACTVACKAEHDIPLGSFRTWVKSVEKGTFPNVRRYFSVLRCNHCANAPCVNICPTRALFRRPDGIVDTDKYQCIGCKSCLAACPYDALYIDANTQTAAKCNYCAHKVENGIEPPCVTVCPEEAIIAGDMNDPGTRIYRLLLEQPVCVRKPEYDAFPRVSYIGGERAVLAPDAAARHSTYAWAQRVPGEASHDFPVHLKADLARVSYDIPHPKPWGFSVSLYLWAKSMAAGPILVAALLGLFRYAYAPLLLGVFAPSMAFGWTLITIYLLMSDLTRPTRFLKLFFHPNWGSWLVWGAYILVLYSIVALSWLGAGFLRLQEISASLLWPGLMSAVLAAGYSAFLLSQARARDLWRSRLLFPHLVAQAFVAGSALLLIGSSYFSSGASLNGFLARCLLAGVCMHGVLILFETALSHKSVSVEGALRFMLQGPLAMVFWLMAALVGIALPICLLTFHIAGNVSGTLLTALSAVSSLIGLLAYEDCFIRAGQALPLS